LTNIFNLSYRILPRLFHDILFSTQRQGGERKKPVGSTTGKPAILSQTDILKDKLTLERVKTPPRKAFSSSATTPTQTARPINNEIKDRRLARLGIQIEPIKEPEKDVPENEDKIDAVF